MGGHHYDCAQCGKQHIAWHSCNHKACPQCGADATARWIERELGKRVNAPYFLVTFTLPSELRGLFFGPDAREAYDSFFAAASGALSEKLASARGTRFAVSGFTAVLQTWNQQLGFHPHLHFLVPGAGINAKGKVVTVRNPEFLLKFEPLGGAFRERFLSAMQQRGWGFDPALRRKEWGVQIQPCGNGAAALKYLGAYVCRSVIGNSRILAMDERSVTFSWKDRSKANAPQSATIEGIEFVRRYLRHVLPRGLRAIRYYGYCHPAATRNRQRVQFHTGRPLILEPQRETAPAPETPWPPCPCCRRPMRRTAYVTRHGSLRPLRQPRPP